MCDNPEPTPEEAELQRLHDELVKKFRAFGAKQAKIEADLARIPDYPEQDIDY